MTDFFKELFQAANSRVRSPFLGSIALAFLAINWQPIFYVLFADQTVLTRFAFFDGNTSLTTLIVMPVVVGVGLALAAPWLQLCGAWFSRSPLRRYRFLQQQEDSERRIHALQMSAREEEAKAQEEEAKERRKIEAAKRLNDAGDVSPEVKAELESVRNSELDLTLLNDLDEPSRKLLSFLSQNESGEMIESRDLAGTTLSINGVEVAQPKNNREVATMRDVVSFLLSKGLLEGEELFDGQSRYRLTAKGYRHADALGYLAWDPNWLNTQ